MSFTIRRTFVCVLEVCHQSASLQRKVFPLSLHSPPPKRIHLEQLACQKNFLEQNPYFGPCQHTLLNF